ncbi:uncharacterized protein Tco025E_05610 [Trypanosoma conorhini]|uniref:Hexosyltransferase n=1 Tax=Trypanosoma conorhini TaxID=83891 RepID=A0A422PBJ8_9TRYP|nr:uncharacterized protein Tco025E_05610 [Trypanosoma conorhini]RNF15092.1 hypothetical protein Tco025E_05610 [Trypanosoma conorhini]
MSRRWVLLIFALVVSLLSWELLFYGEEDLWRAPQRPPATVVECDLSRHARAVSFLGVVARLCGQLCTASVRPSFCDRGRFLQAHGRVRFDFSQTPSADVEGEIETVDVVYVATGERFYGAGGQSYVLDSIRQWRCFHSPRESRVFLVLDDAHVQDPRIVALREPLGITLIPASQAVTSRLERYRSLFYIQGFMHPGGNRSTGNKQFNRLVTERFFVLAAVMRRLRLRHVLHVENDNMIYANMRGVLRAIARCGYRMASTAPSAEGFVPGVVYVKDAESVEHFADYVNDFLSCGRRFGVAVSRAVTRKRDPYANDMTYMMNYYQLFGSAYMGELPAWLHAAGENCIVESSREMGLPPYLFDAASFGQWYSFAALDGALLPPARIRRAARRRYLNVTPPPPLTWAAKGANRVPFWNAFRLVSLHIHAKNLRNFSSR